MSWKKYFFSKNVLITGAGNGIGREMALLLRAVAKNLVLVDNSQAALNETLRIMDLKKNNNPPNVFCLDVTDAEKMREMRRSLAADKFPDIVVANAGIAGINPAHNFSMEFDRKIMEINYFGVIHTLAPFIDEMIKRKSGHLVGVSSLASIRGLPFASSYCASKSAQNALLESWRNDLKPFGIRVSSLLPGFVRTQMTDHNEFPLLFEVTAKYAAEKCVKAIACRRKLYLFPWPMKILSIINKFLPVWIFDIIIPLGAGDGSKKSPRLFFKR